MALSVKQIMDAQIATWKSLFSQLYNVRPYDGRFEAGDIDQVTLDPPELFITYNGGPTYTHTKKVVDHDGSWLVVIAAKQSGLTSNENETAPWFAVEIPLALQRQTWGLDSGDIGFPAAISGAPIAQRTDGIILWGISFDQAFRTGTGDGDGLPLGG